MDQQWCLIENKTERNSLNWIRSMNFFVSLSFFHLYIYEFNDRLNRCSCDICVWSSKFKLFIMGVGGV